MITFNSQFISIEKLKEQGYSYYKINKLVKEGILKKINKKTYECLNYKGDHDDFILVNAYISDGVICELSAAFYYGLINYVPSSVYVAINRDKKVSTMPDWPTVDLRYYSKNRLNTGVIEIKKDGNTFKIYDIEKTIIDLLSFRNKLPIDEVVGALKNYLKRKDRNINKLYKYSKMFRCEKILRIYLETLL